MNTLARNKFEGRNIFKTYGLVFALVALLIILSVLNPYFMSVNNLLNVLNQVSINGYLAIGMMLVMLTAGIDLSVGAILALCGVFAAQLAQSANPNANVALAILVSLGVGTGLGLINGLLVSRLKIVPFIATLAVMSISRGMTYIQANARPVTGLTNVFLDIGTGKIGLIPIPVIILVVIIIVIAIFLYRIKLGRFIYAVGGNENAARISGVNVANVKLVVYGVSGLMAGIAAIILTARVSSGLPQAGEGYEMDAIAACAIGGTSLSGGRGKLWGTVIGILLIGFMSNGMNMLNVSSYYQMIIKGLIILLAVWLDARRAD
jgi:ribose/xylose/arabinose/galactoside ABC-type transport system permease subunit